MKPLVDTQKIRLQLQSELKETEDAAVNETNVHKALELATTIRWIKNKLNFLNSPEYQKRKAATK